MGYIKPISAFLCNLMAVNELFGAIYDIFWALPNMDRINWGDCQTVGKMKWEKASRSEGLGCKAVLFYDIGQMSWKDEMCLTADLVLIKSLNLYRVALFFVLKTIHSAQ